MGNLAEARGQYGTLLSPPYFHFPITITTTLLLASETWACSSTVRCSRREPAATPPRKQQVGAGVLVGGWGACPEPKWPPMWMTPCPPVLFGSTADPGRPAGGGHRSTMGACCVGGVKTRSRDLCDTWRRVRTGYLEKQHDQTHIPVFHYSHVFCRLLLRVSIETRLTIHYQSEHRI